jgi:hypothetical protein
VTWIHCVQSTFPSIKPAPSRMVLASLLFNPPARQNMYWPLPLALLHWTWGAKLRLGPGIPSVVVVVALGIVLDLKQCISSSRGA